MEALKTPALQTVFSPTRFGESALASASAQGGHGVCFSSSAVFKGSFRKQLVTKAAWVTRKGRAELGNGAGNSCVVAAAAAAVADHEAVTTTGSNSGTLYSVLGVECGGSFSAIKSAYRRMARRYHPDVCVLDDRDVCMRKFLAVRHAYEILSVPEKRAEYDYASMHPSFAQALGNRSSFFRTSGRSGQSRGTQGSVGESDAWRFQWEAQLSRLRRRGISEMTSNSNSISNLWGARMRRARNEN